MRRLRVTKKLMKELREDLSGRFEDALDGMPQLDPLAFYEKRDIAESCVESVISSLEFIAGQK